jgi:molecular chaperone Hsp33
MTHNSEKRSSPKLRQTASGVDAMHRFLLANGTIRGALVQGSALVQNMRIQHGLGLIETLVLGHAYLGALLMTSGFKSREGLALQVDCSGPIKGLVVEANAQGDVRGYLKRVPIPVDQPLTAFNLSPFFGAGFLRVTRYLESARQPFVGQVALQYGNLAQDLAYYYLQSEQIHTAVNLSIQFDPQGEIVGAGGLLLQLMPHAAATVIAPLEDIIHGLPSLGQTLAYVADLRGFIKDRFGVLDLKLLDRRRIRCHCPCNRQRFRTMLQMLPAADLEALATQGPYPVVLHCHYCGREYLFSEGQLQNLYAMVDKH